MKAPNQAMQTIAQTKTVQNTPTPFEVDDQGMDTYCNIRGKDNYLVCRTVGSRMLEDAAFIVRACNNFDEMLAFIKNIAATNNHDGNRAKEIVAKTEGRS